MAIPASIAEHHEPFQKLIRALENMDNLIIEASQEYFNDRSTPPTLTARVLGIFGYPAGGESHTSESQLRILETAREDYQTNNYDIESMMRYLSRISELAPMWDLATASMLRLKDIQAASSSHMAYWRVRYRRLERAGAVAGHLAVSVYGILIARDSEALPNAIIDKFTSLDDVLHLEFGQGGSKGTVLR
jgi:hypothetical protein